MNRYWPSRNSPEGFSIEKLARSYRDKLSQKSQNNNESLSLVVRKDIEESNKEKASGVSIHEEYLGHWANRGFEEYYLDAA